jgi:hypothetical protein
MLPNSNQPGPAAVTRWISRSTIGSKPGGNCWFVAQFVPPLSGPVFSRSGSMSLASTLSLTRTTAGALGSADQPLPAVIAQIPKAHRHIQARTNLCMNLAFPFIRDLLPRRSRFG